MTRWRGTGVHNRCVAELSCTWAPWQRLFLSLIHFWREYSWLSTFRFHLRLNCGYSNNKPPIFDGLYHPFMVIRGMVCYWYTNIIPFAFLRGLRRVLGLRSCRSSPPDVLLIHKLWSRSNNRSLGTLMALLPDISTHMTPFVECITHYNPTYSQL